MTLAAQLIESICEATWKKSADKDGRPVYKHSLGAKTFWKGKVGWLEFKGKEYNLGRKASFGKAEKIIGDVLSS